MAIHPPNRLFSSLYRAILYRLVGKVVLLLTTTGRCSGKPHTVGLQYELINGDYWVGAADGNRADWYRNLLKNPRVSLHVGAKKLTATADVITDADQIVDFLAYRYQKRPFLIGMILRLDGFKEKVSRPSLSAYAAKIGMVIFAPDPPQSR